MDGEGVRMMEMDGEGVRVMEGECEGRWLWMVRE